MSPSNINSFVGDLVAMAQATEELPKAQQTIADLQRQLDEAQRHNQGLEQNILGYKEQITHWQDQAKVLSDQRDNAELRAMELEDKNNAVSRFLGTLMGDANSLRNVIDPPKPEPVAQPPVEDHTPPSVDTSADVSQAVAPDQGSMYELVREQGQSEAHPTVQHQDSPKTAPSPHATSGDAGSTTTEHSGDSHSEASVNPEPSWAGEAKPTPADPSQRFANMMYEDYAHWVPRSDWIAGGGTDWSYDFRKSHVDRGF
jgi:hypothetical protein